MLPPSGQVNVSAPLSVLKTTMVLSASPMSSRCFRMAPTLSSICFMPASSRPIVGLAVLIDPVLLREERPDVHAGRVVPDEERLAILLGLVHEVAGALHEHFVERRHVVLGLHDEMSCMLGTFDMSGNGGSGPSSTIFCLPILPQRGCSVGSSVSVA